MWWMDDMGYMDIGLVEVCSFVLMGFSLEKP